MKNTSDPCDFFACAGLDRDQIRQLAFETGFCERASGKINAPDFLIHLCLQSVAGTVSCNDLAARVEAHTGVAASRQAYWERTDESCLRFFQRILERIMLSKCSPDDIRTIRRQGRFKRILLQDSTIIKLPLRLFEAFSGVKNAHTAVCNARIQGIYDLLSGHFLQFSIDPYSKNDQAATLEIPMQAGDLVLRDRDYFRIQVIEQHKRAGADSINRYKHYTALYDPATGQKINLLELLTSNGSVDMMVSAGREQTVPIRLIAVPAPEETAKGPPQNNLNNFCAIATYSVCLFSAQSYSSCDSDTGGRGAGAPYSRCDAHPQDVDARPLFSALLAPEGLSTL